MTLRRVTAQGDIRFKGATIRSDLDLGGPGSIDGSLIAEDATIQGELNVAELTISNDLNLRTAKVSGAVFARVDQTKDPCPRVRGEIQAEGASLADVYIRFDPTAEAGPSAVHFTGAEVDSLVLAGTLSAEHAPTEDSVSPGADLRRLACDEFSWKQLDVSGLEGHGLAPGDDASERYRRFLMRCEFRQSLYLRLEDWLTNHGRDADADDVHLMLRQVELARRTPHWLRWLFVTFSRRRLREMRTVPPSEVKARPRSLRLLLSTLAQALVLRFLGFGVRTWPAWLFLAASMALSTWVFSNPASVQRPVGYGIGALPAAQTAPTDHRTFPVVTTSADPRSWGWTHALLISARHHVPVVDLPTLHDWEASERRVLAPDRLSLLGATGRWVTQHLTFDRVAAITSMFGWLFIPLLIAASMRMLKKLK